MPAKRLTVIPDGFPTDLLKPIPRKAGNGSAGGQSNLYRTEYMRRLLLLAKYYGIPEGDKDFVVHLLLKVLTNWVPGFREHRRGRPGDTALSEKCARLVTAVADLKRMNPQLSDNSACRLLASATGTREKEFRGAKPDTLRKWLRLGLAERKRKNALLGKLLKEMSLSDPGETAPLGLYGTAYSNPVGT